MLPQIRQAPWFPGQIGVPGSDVQRGLRWSAKAIVLYVDSTHNNGSDTADGTDPENPLLTIAQAIANLTAFEAAMAEQLEASYIVVSGPVTESVSILNYTTVPEHVTLIGRGNSEFWPPWGSEAADEPCLIAGGVGWRITGFRFYVPEAAAAIVVPCTQAPYGANAIGIRTVIDHCYLDGSDTVGLYGIDLHGAPYNVNIVDNVFGFLNGGAGFGIVSTNTGYADAYRARIERNWFHESDGGIDASLNVSLVKDNVFTTGGLTTMDTPLDLRTGTRGENTVTGNVFGGDYSNTGGYYANVANPGNWVGNIAQDVAEPEVSASGFTIAIPAA